jgi:hypothetical protein
MGVGVELQREFAKSDRFLQAEKWRFGRCCNLCLSGKKKRF